MNFIGITGRLGQDPQLIYAKSGIAVVNFSIAQKTKRQGQEKTNWYDCVSFGKTAELISQHFYKGDQIGVTGSLSDESYTDKQGVKHKKVAIVVNQISWDASIQSRNNNQQQQPQQQSQQMPVGHVPPGTKPSSQPTNVPQGTGLSNGMIEDPF